MVFDTNVAYKGQRYKRLKTECLKANKLFTDPEFPPQSKSLYFSRQAPADIVWKRPQVCILI
jgi:calpain-5